MLDDDQDSTIENLNTTICIGSIDVLVDMVNHRLNNLNTTICIGSMR